MGYHIEAVFQKKVNGEWEEIESTWEQNRDHLLFSWLVGFKGYREDIDPISPARGFPEDFCGSDIHGWLSPLSWALGDEPEYNDEGLHSYYSYLDVNEILEAERPDKEGELDYFIDEMRRLKEEHGEVRMVFYVGGH